MAINPLGTILIIATLVIVAIFGGQTGAFFKGYSLNAESVEKGEDITIVVDTPACRFGDKSTCSRTIKGFLILDDNPNKVIGQRITEYGKTIITIPSSDLSVGKHKITLLSQTNNPNDAGNKFFLSDQKDPYQFYLNYKNKKIDGSNIYSSSRKDNTCKNTPSPTDCCIEAGANGYGTKDGSNDYTCIHLADPRTATLDDGTKYLNFQWPPTKLEETFFVLPKDEFEEQFPDAEKGKTDPEKSTGFIDSIRNFLQNILNIFGGNK